MDNKNNLLSVNEASRYLSMSERTIQRLSKQGKIKGIRFGGRWKFSKKDIEEYLSSGIDFSKTPVRIPHYSSLKPEQATERRYFPRINCALLCSLKVIIPTKKQVYASGMILNISKGGIFLENYKNDTSFLNIRNDDPVNLSFKLFEDNKLEQEGRMVRIQNKGIAIKFKNLHSNVREIIKEYVG